MLRSDFLAQSALACPNPPPVLSEYTGGRRQRRARDVPHGDPFAWQTQRTDDRLDPPRSTQAAEPQEIGLQVCSVLSAHQLAASGC
jgi:hypothetical protein